MFPIIVQHKLLRNDTSYPEIKFAFHGIIKYSENIKKKTH